MNATRRHSASGRASGGALSAIGLLAWAWAGLSCAAVAGPASAPAPASSPKQSSATATIQPVDINSASKAQLMSLPGIGDAEADRIVAGRPYLSKADLATRNVIPTGVYLSLKNRIIAIQKTSPKGKA
jgi:competence protein ComEA